MEVSFSGDGAGSFASLTEADRAFSLTWPGKLPAPVVDGDTATYRSVLPGVDLVARATVYGFTHVMVVRTREAARSAAVRQIRLKLGGGTKVEGRPDGSLAALAEDRLVATAQPAVMWDSAAEQAGEIHGLGDTSALAGSAEPSPSVAPPSIEPSTSPTTSASPSPEQSSARLPGDHAAMGRVKVRPSPKGDELTLDIHGGVIL